jgi:hypothetical protein
MRRPSASEKEGRPAQVAHMSSARRGLACRGLRFCWACNREELFVKTKWCVYSIEETHTATFTTEQQTSVP